MTDIYFQKIEQINPFKVLKGAKSSPVELIAPDKLFSTDKVRLSPFKNDVPLGNLQSPVIFFNNSEYPGIPAKLKEAGTKSYLKHKGVNGACEATAIDLHKKLLGKSSLSVRTLPKAEGLNENGKPLDYLKTLIDSGKLKPGMLIFINTIPSMPLSNLKPSNRHWFTYMGTEAGTGKPVFHDQYGTNRGLNEILRFKKVKNPDIAGNNGRKIHTIFDPYKNRPDLLS